MKEAVFEAFERINALEDDNQRAVEIEKLPALKQLIALGLAEGSVFDLPLGTPPYTHADDITTHGMLWQEIRRLYLFVPGGNANLTPTRRELLYIQMLESLHPKDADLINQLKDKQWCYTNIDVEFVNKFFPTLLRG